MRANAMKKTVSANSPQRLQRSARKLDRKAALDQQARGLSTSEIAQLQQVHVSTVRRFMDRMKPEQAAIEDFKNGRADVLARIQSKSLDLQERIIESFDDGILSALTAHQKSGLLLSCNAIFGTTHDKERLERGKTTANIGLVARLMGEAFRTAHTSTQGQREEAAALEADEEGAHDASPS
jgi:hypothetical protein